MVKQAFSVTICERIILNLQFLFMTFVQNQELTIPENVRYISIITELIESYCYKGLSHTVLGPTDVNLCMSHSRLDL